MRKLFALAALLMLAAAAFLLVDFRLVRSVTNIDSTTASGHSATTSNDPQQKMRVFVWVEEKDRLSTLLRDRLLAGLRQTGRFEPELLPTARPGPNDFPLLRVWIQRPGLGWTPVYANANMQVRAGFSSYQTDIRFTDDPKEPVRFHPPAGDYGLDAYFTLNLTDQTYGLISLPGYWDHLSQQAAGRLVTELERASKVE